MATKFYSYWVFVSQDHEINNASTQDLANQLQTILGTHRLLSLTSSATNSVVVTTIAYEVPDEKNENRITYNLYYYYDTEFISGCMQMYEIRKGFLCVIYSFDCNIAPYVYADICQQSTTRLSK